MATPFDAAEKLDLAAFRRSLQFMESPRRARGGHARTAGERPDLEYGGARLESTPLIWSSTHYRCVSSNQAVATWSELRSSRCWVELCPARRAGCSGVTIIGVLGESNRLLDAERRVRGVQVQPCCRIVGQGIWTCCKRPAKF